MEWTASSELEVRRQSVVVDGDRWGSMFGPSKADTLGLPGSLLTRDPVGAMLYALCLLRIVLPQTIVL